MSVASAILLTYAAVHFFATLMAAFLYLRMRAQEYVAFGGLSLSVATYVGAAAFIADSASPAEALPWVKLEFAAGSLVFLALSHYAYEMVGAPSKRIVRWVAYACAIGVPMTFAGFFNDADAWVMPRLVLAHPEMSFLPNVTPALYAYSVVGVVLGSAMLLGLLSAARKATDARFLFPAVLLLVLGIGIDSTLSYFRILTYRYAWHAVSVSALLCAYLLLHRFVRTINVLSDKTDELRHRYDELAQVQEELVLKEQLAAVGELSAVIAHEVRTPLSVIRTSAAALRDDSLKTNERDGLLAALDEENDRLNRLVRDLLTYARPVDPQTKPFSLETILRRAVETAHQPREEDIRIEYDLEYAPDLLEGDADLLGRAFLNIAENALQAMPRGGVLGIRVALTVHDKRPAVALRFSDTGEGMDTMIRAHATDPFFTTRPGGTGLGLAIVERVVRAHGGVVTLESQGVEGSTVSLVLPSKTPQARS